MTNDSYKEVELARLVAIPFRAILCGSAFIYSNDFLNRLTVLSHSEIDALSKMQECRTREEHAYFLASNASRVGPMIERLFSKGEWSEHPPGFSKKLFTGFKGSLLQSLISEQLKIINKLEALGLLVTESHILKNLRSCDSLGAEVDSRIGCLGIITGDRPELLSRSLSANLELIAKYRSSCLMLIVDDSKTATARRLNRDAVSRFSQHHRGNIALVGEVGRAKVVEELSKLAEVDPKIVFFALSRHAELRTLGASRNLAHLLSAGTMAMFSDDDTCPKYFSNISIPSHLCHISAAVPSYRTDFFVDRQAWESNVSYDSDFNIFEFHEQVLGSSLISLRQKNRRFALSSYDQSLFNSLVCGNCKIGISTGGPSGDSGMWSSAGFILGSSGMQPSLHSNDESYYQRVRTSRYILHLPQGLQITSSPQLQAMSYGIDLRDMHVPFFPFGRNTDGAFASLVHKVLPQMLFAHLPIAIWHDPLEVRRYALEPVDALLALRMTDWVILLISSANLPLNVEPKGALLAVGWHLKSMLSLGPKEFESMLSALVLQRRAVHVIQAKKTLEKLDKGSSWSMELVRMVDRLTNEVVTARSLVPYELRSRSTEKAFTFMKDVLLRYADLLCEWPAIIEAAKIMSHISVIRFSEQL